MEPLPARRPALSGRLATRALSACARPAIGLALLTCPLILAQPALAADQLLMGTDIAIHASASVSEQNRTLWFDAFEISEDLEIEGNPIISGGTLQFVLEVSSGETGDSDFQYFAYELPAKSRTDGTPLWRLSTEDTSEEGISSGFDYLDEALEHGPVSEFKIRKKVTGEFTAHAALSGQNAEQLLDLNFSSEILSVYVVFTAHGTNPSNAEPDPSARTCMRFQREESVVCEDEGGVALYASQTCDGQPLTGGAIAREKGCPPLRDPCPASSGEACQPYYVSPDGCDDATCGTSEAPFRTVAYAASRLASGDALLVRSGLYAENQRIILSGSDITIVGDGLPVIDASYSELKDTSDDSWELWHDATAESDAVIYRSIHSYEIQDPSVAFQYVAASFEFRGKHHKLVPYPCYAALASTHGLYFWNDKTACTLENGSSSSEDFGRDVYNFECTVDSQPIVSSTSKTFSQQQSRCPYIGPGIYWDSEGTVDPRAQGRLYVRLNTSTPQFDWLENRGDPYREIPTNPNQVSIRAHLQGTYLYQESLAHENLQISGLKLVHGAVRVGGDSTGTTLRGVRLDGTTSDNAVEIYSGASAVTLDAMTIDDLLPDWVTWDDVKTIYKNQLMNHGISFNAASSGDDVIHDVSISNSTVANIHDGIEMVSEAYRNVSVTGNRFENIQDDVIQLGTASHDIDINHNEMIDVATSVSKQGQTQENPYPGTRYIHHNVIDVSEEKLYCRQRENESDYTPSSCDADGANTRDAFGKHDANGTHIDGESRYIYNNTIVLNGGEVDYGFDGEYYRDSNNNFIGLYPYGVPSLFFNNIIVQKDETAVVEKAYPNWHRHYMPFPASPAETRGPILIADGNLYYRSPGHDENAFRVNLNYCDFADFRTNFCSDTESGSEAGAATNTYFWDEESDSAMTTLSRSWEIEGRGLYGDPGLNDDYEPTNCSLLNSLDAVELATVTSHYFVTDISASGDEGWELDLSNTASGVLPGTDEGASYRGAYNSCGEDSTPVPEPSFTCQLTAGLLGLQLLTRRQRARRAR